MNLSAMLQMEAVIHFFLSLLSYTAHKLLCSPSTFCSSQLHVWESDYLWVMLVDHLKIYSLFKKLILNIEYKNFSAGNIKFQHTCLPKLNSLTQNGICVKSDCVTLKSLPLLKQLPSQTVSPKHRPNI